MTFTFNQASKAYADDKLDELAADYWGLRFLLIRQLSRREHLERLAQDNNLSLPRSRNINDKLRVVFDSAIDNSDLVQLTHTIYAEERRERAKEEPTLISELYKMNAFDWGGLYQNNLEQTIVNNYVKKIKRFDQLNEAVDGDLHESLRGYTQCSWYNHWTSIIIEDIFKEHKNVTPVVGLIKKIDFFVGQIPFDLKVTYLPEGYIKEWRRRAALGTEISAVKRCARSLKIEYDSNLPESRLLEDLWKKLSDHPSPQAHKTVQSLRDARLDIINETTRDPSALIHWLYVNQGIRRFDSSNRLFLVLINTSDFFSSWKLKRAKPLIESEVANYLDRAGATPGQNLSFSIDGSQYTTRSDAIVISHQA